MEKQNKIKRLRKLTAIVTLATALGLGGCATNHYYIIGPEGVREVSEKPGRKNRDVMGCVYRGVAKEMENLADPLHWILPNDDPRTIKAMKYQEEREKQGYTYDYDDY